ncbi:MAG: ATP-binding protein [Chloroflexi bacterium]|nr:ATP-binding protein [Chloroflexota bacterium]
MLKPLPVGIQTFSDLIRGGFLYVDKTPWIYELIRYSKGAYFLARPRRFGKSLLISTLGEIFEGNRELFQGLWLYDSDYSWTIHPVIRLDFSRYSIRSVEDLSAALQRAVQQTAERYGVTIEPGRYEFQFEDLVRRLAERGQVVILVDEYDKPILDNITDLPTARQIRESLKGFYTSIKSLDAYLRLVFLTGISKFSKVGVFSGLNNLNDISMNANFGALVGITEAELRSSFHDHIAEFARAQKTDSDDILAQMQHWYNGFRFAAHSERVYNPFSLLLAFYQQRFSNFWFESGTPTFLIDLIRDRGYDVRQLGNLRVEEFSFSTYELENLDLEPLLFQTGYLTIKTYDEKSRIYTLSYPNYEVENAFLHYLLRAHSEISLALTTSTLWRLAEALRANDLERFFELLDVFFANIPYDIQLRHEHYYQTVFYLIFKLIGLRVEAEARTSRGRIDAVVALEKAVYLFEFKVDGSEEEALAQIVERDYYRRYAGQERPLVLVGVNFSTQSRSVTAWRTA